VSDRHVSGGGSVRRRVVVTGQVQGVFYRDSCRREARSRGLAGWVRNLPDGSVEAVFEGAPDAVEAMVAWARVGPPQATVSELAARDEKPEGLSGFTVR
jgi:acylphosphatase